MQIIDTPVDGLSQARFIKNTCCSGCLIDDLANGAGQPSLFMIARTVFMTPDEYEEFAKDLKAEQIWLEELGGYLSKDERNPHEFTTAEELEHWEENSYRECVAVKCSGYPTLYVDAQTKGHPVWVAASIETGN